MKKSGIITLIIAGTLLAGCTTPDVQRFGSVIGLKEEALAEYKRLHVEVWPDVLKLLSESNIRNYSIYLTQFDDGKYYLFSYLEYTGSDATADFGRLAGEPVIQKWWELTDPLQIPLKTRTEGEHWKSMDEVFHMK
ncbi:MAG TPA: L-rhamnose mutarotase [Tichowtungia sp.]|nr:L-rhamnose mutarotase [Tichowtungia sp.]